MSVQHTKPIAACQIGRRQAVATVIVGALASACGLREAVGEEGGFVSIVPIAADGSRGPPARRTKLVRSEDEWRARLTPMSFAVTRHAATEVAFTGEYWNQHEAGLYRCVCCESGVFASTAKYDSGTGWPSFTKPIAVENVIETRDFSFGMLRTAVACRLCDAHLGHVFNDGPRPAGLRYCINSAALHFVPLARA